MPHTRPAPAWAIVLGFTLIYLTWGTTYLATSIGVREQHMPPLLFGGTRITLAGFLLLGWQLLRGTSCRVAWREVPAIVGTSLLMFLCGNGLVNIGQQTVNSGMAAVIVATTPLWIGLFSMLFPHGDRLTPRGWLGLFVGLGGVVVLLSPKFHESGALFADLGWLCVIASAISWALGSLLTRHFKSKTDHLTSAAYHLICGGLALTIVGFARGEDLPSAEQINNRVIGAYMYLLIVGSLMGFVSFNFLLGHVSAAKVGTYAYVNPIVAVLVGWAAGEGISAALVGGIAVILAGVFLVRGGEQPYQATTPDETTNPTAAVVDIGEGNPG